MSTPRLRLGQLLVDAKMISEEDLQVILALQRADGRRLGTLLLERGLINETQLTQILSHQLSVPWVSLLHIEFSRKLLNLVPHDVADRYCLVPIYVRHVRRQGETLYVAMDDPSNEDALSACSEYSGLPVRAMIAPPSDIRNAIRVYYGVQGARLEPPERVETEAPPPKVESVRLTPVLEVNDESVRATDSLAEVSGTLTESLTLSEISADMLEEEEAQLSAEAPREEETQRSSEALMEEQAQLSAEAPLSAEALSAAATMRGAEGDAPVIASGNPVSASDASVQNGSIPDTPPPAPWRRGGLLPAQRLRAILHPDASPPSSTREVADIPTPRGRTPRMVGLTLLDGTTLSLPAKRRRRALELGESERPPGESSVQPTPSSQPAPTPVPPSDQPGSAEAHLTAHDLVKALRAMAQGADASEVLGNDVRWEAIFAALLSLLLKKHLIADWEFVDELKKKI
jgi:hypothetical protein